MQYRLVVRDVNTLQILQLYTCLDQIQYIEWSSDSLFILCAMYKRGIVQVRTKARQSVFPSGDLCVLSLSESFLTASAGSMLLLK